ncbi:MAG: FkbM family methyltransferase, partial [Minisyncoccia bacterium]
MKINKNWIHKKYNVLVLRLDSLLKLLNFQKIDFLKIDVEGVKLFILRSLGESLSKVFYILFEFSEENYKKFGYSEKDIFSFLEKTNFKIHRLIFENGKFYFKIVKSIQEIPSKICINLLASINELE